MSPMVTPMTRPFAVDVKLRGSGSGWTESERMAATGSASRGLLVPHARQHLLCEVASEHSLCLRDGSLHVALPASTVIGRAAEAGNCYLRCARRDPK